MIPARTSKTYEFTGAQSNYAEFAEVFSQVLGRKITYVPVTLEQNAQALKARDMPDWLIIPPRHRRAACR